LLPRWHGRGSIQGMIPDTSPHLSTRERLAARPEATGLPSVLITFDPHPLEVVNPEAAPPLLTTGAERLEILADQDGVWRCRTIFNCTDACPRGINITQAILEVSGAIVARRV